MRYNGFMKKKRLITVIAGTLAVLILITLIAALTPVRIPAAAQDKLAVFTRNKPDAEITVAVVRGDSEEIRTFGHDGTEIPVPDRFYELGPVSRTFTGAVVAKAVEDGYLSLDTTVSDLLSLTPGAYQPTVYDLLTHSSAYGTYAPDVSRFRSGNPFRGISGTDIVSSMNRFILKYSAPYLYCDSDFGVAVLSTLVAKAYNVDYYSILTLFIQNSLHLNNTYVSVGGAIDHGWQWNYDDAYLGGLGLTSNVTDLVAYVRLLLNEPAPFLHRACDALYEVNAEFQTGYLWNISPRDWILSQSGSTGHYSSAVMIDKNKGTAVIVLSNYPDDRYGSTEDIASALLNEMS